MWKSLHRAQYQDFYTSPEKLVSTAEYYRTHTQSSSDPYSNLFDRDLARQLFVFENSPSNSTTVVSPGDLVECITRDGAEIAFGVVVARMPLQSQVLIYNLDGTLSKYPISSIHLRILQVFDPAILLTIFSKEINSLVEVKGDPNKSFFSSTPSITTVEETPNPPTLPKTIKLSLPKSTYTYTLLTLLKMIIRASLESYEGGALSSAFPVVYAHASSGPVRTFPLNLLAHRALDASRKLPRPGSSKTSSGLSHVTSIIATHLWVSNSPEYWYTFPPTLNSSDSKSIIDNSNSSSERNSTRHDTGDGKWIPAPTIAVQDTQYIMHEIGEKEYISFARYVRRRIQENNNLPVDEIPEKLDESALERFSKLLGFLKRYIVYPHTDCDHVIDTILKQVYSDILNKPRATAFIVHKMLIDADLVGTSNAYLDSGLVLDHEKGMIVDEYTDRAPSAEKASLLDPRTFKFQQTHQKWPQKIPVYAFHTKDSKAQLAISVEMDQPKWKIHVHVPNLASWYGPTSSIMSVGLRRARTVWLPEGIRRLFPQELLERTTFSSDMEYIPCLTFTVEMEGWNSTSWGASDVSVSLTRIPKSSISLFALEDLSKTMGWIKVSSNTVPVVDDVFDLNLDEVLSGDLKDDLTILGDTDMLHDSEFLEAPMGIIPAEKQSNEIELSPTEKQNLQLIYDIFSENYWKRMEEGSAVYETETKQYLVTIGSKSSSAKPQMIGQPTDKQIFASDFLVTEGNILAGEIASVFGSRENVPLLYEKQQRLQKFGLEDSGKRLEREGLATDLKDVSGQLTRAGRYLAASSQYLGPRETTSEPYHVHFGLGLAAGFAGVARPFDDMRHVMNQWQLTTTLMRPVGEPWRRLTGQELQLVHDTQVSPRAHALDQLEEVSQRYWALRWLEQEVSRFGGYFVFRCVVVAPQSAPRSYEPRPTFARVYCVELGFEVDLMLVPTEPQPRQRRRGLLGYLTGVTEEKQNKEMPFEATTDEEKIALGYEKMMGKGATEPEAGTQLKSGDRIISTDILELDPVRGHLVLGI